MYNKSVFQSLSQKYKSNLLDDVIPFWERFSMDEEYGGYFTCLMRDGKIYDTDKFIWLQSRQAWMFAYLYNHVENKPNWLEISRHGVNFLQDHGKDSLGNWYFSCDRKGKPLTQPFNIFSDCFAALALGEFAKASGDDKFRLTALETYHNIIKRKENPKGQYNKTIPETRSLKGFALPMIICNLTMELDSLLPTNIVSSNIAWCVNEIMNVFLDPETLMILEAVNNNGDKIDSFEGRLINPGHGIEAMWFMMDVGRWLQNSKLIIQAVDVVISILENSWDTRFGGIFYFLDSKGYPLQQLEWDQKLWWVHLETLVALSKGFCLTQDPRCLEWYDRVHKYTWGNFPDPEYGEWFGYLNRRGEVLLSLKGGKWKGCFHVPRSLYQCWKTFDDIVESHG